MSATGIPTTGKLPAHRDLEAALMRLRRAIDSETEPLYHRKDTGHTDVLPVLGRISLLLLELGFTVGEEAGIDCTGIERAVSAAYGLPVA